MIETDPKLHIAVITLFPDIFENHLKHLPLSRAMAKKLIQVDLVNLRDFAIDKRGTVDSPPYGGGPGMILRPEPIYSAVTSVINETSVEDVNNHQILFLTPRGKTYTQNDAIKLSKTEHLIITCGRYEGMDQRVIDYFVNQHNAQEISIGNYILSGGEVPAMVIMESVVRLIPGAIDNQDALINESFNPNQPNWVEHPQYSRPEIWRDQKVPDTLISGHHENIAKWKGL